MKANALLKQNIDTLLRARGQTRRELACWVRQSVNPKKVDPWISQIFTQPNREFQTKYLDRIAEFFGLAVYQLFQPGISSVTERRRVVDRRRGQDRRISARNHTLPVTPIRQIDISPEDEALLAEIKGLSYDEAQRLRYWVSVVKFGRPGARDTATPAPPPAAAPESAARRRTR